MERRSFFEGYRPTNLTADPLPLKVLNHSIWNAEMLGHALDWALQYLHQKSCPTYLISPLLGKVLEEIATADLSACYANSYGGKVSDQVDGDVEEENVSYQPLKLMQSVTTAVDNICLRYKEENDRIETDFAMEGNEKDAPPSLVFGASYHSIKNTRRTMEDRMVVLPDIDKVFRLKRPANYFAVFDGHNGVEAAAYSAAHLHRYLVSSPDFPDDLSAALNYAFEATDTALLMKCKDESIRSGTTAVVALIVPNNIYVAWAGDSQAFLVRNGKPESLVSPHKPDREDEMRRIKSVGGEVISISGTWRVNGNLAVSRAIGNLDYKEYVTSTPEISHIVTTGSEEFLILACDGLWDVVSPQRCVDILRDNLISDNPSDIDTVGQKLVLEAKRSGSGDNITVIVVFLKSKEDLIKVYKSNKMNGNAEVEVPTQQAPASPPKVAEATKTPAVAKASPVSGTKSHVSPTKTTGTTATRSSLGSRTTAPAKAPASRLSSDRKPATTTRAPLAATKPATATSAAKTSMQKDNSAASSVAGSARPAARRPISGMTGRTQVASKTATSTSTTSAAKKPLKPEETEKTGAAKPTAPRTRPGTAPLSSRVTAASKVAPKVETGKPGEDSKETLATKRSALTTKSTAPSSRVAPTRQPVSTTATKPRVPASTTTTTRPVSAAQTQRTGPGATAARKPVGSLAASASARPPLKKPTAAAAAAKKEPKANGQPVPVTKRILPGKIKAAEPASTAKVNGVSDKPVNGEQVSSDVKDVNGVGVSNHEPQLDEKEQEAQESVVTSSKVDDSLTAPVAEKITESIDLLGSCTSEPKESASTGVEIEAAPALSSDKVNEDIPKQSHVLNGDLIGYVENLDAKPSEVAENEVEALIVESKPSEPLEIEQKPCSETDVNVNEVPIVAEVSESVALEQQAPVSSESPELKVSEETSASEINLISGNEVLEPEAAVEIAEQKADDVTYDSEKSADNVTHDSEKSADDVINFNRQSFAPEVKEQHEITDDFSAQETAAVDNITSTQEELSVDAVEALDMPETGNTLHLEEAHVIAQQIDLEEAESGFSTVEGDRVAGEELHPVADGAEDDKQSDEVQSSVAVEQEHETDRAENLDTVAVEAVSPDPVREGSCASAMSPEPCVETEIPALSPEPTFAEDVPSHPTLASDSASNGSPEPIHRDEIPAQLSTEPADEGTQVTVHPEMPHSPDFLAATSAATVEAEDFPSAQSPEIAEGHEDRDVGVSPNPLAEQEVPEMLSPEPSEQVPPTITPKPREEIGISDGQTDELHCTTENILEVELEQSIPSAVSPDLFEGAGEPDPISPEPCISAEILNADPRLTDKEVNILGSVAVEEHLSEADQFSAGAETQQPAADVSDDLLGEHLHPDCTMQQPLIRGEDEEQLLAVDQDKNTETNAVDPELFSTQLLESSGGNPFVHHCNPFAVEEGLEINSQFSSGEKATIPDFSGSGFENFENSFKTSSAVPGHNDLDNMFGNNESCGQHFNAEGVTWSNNNEFKFEGQGHKELDTTEAHFTALNTQEISDPFATDAQVNGKKLSEIGNEFDELGLQHPKDYHQEALLDLQASSPVPASDKIHSAVDPGSQVDALGN